MLSSVLRELSHLQIDAAWYPSCQRFILHAWREITKFWWLFYRSSVRLTQTGHSHSSLPPSSAHSGQQHGSWRCCGGDMWVISAKQRTKMEIGIGWQAPDTRYRSLVQIHGLGDPILLFDESSVEVYDIVHNIFRSEISYWAASKLLLTFFDDGAGTRIVFELDDIGLNLQKYVVLTHLQKSSQHRWHAIWCIGVRKWSTITCERASLNESQSSLFSDMRGLHKGWNSTE